MNKLLGAVGALVILAAALAFVAYLFGPPEVSARGQEALGAIATGVFVGGVVIFILASEWN